MMTEFWILTGSGEEIYFKVAPDVIRDDDLVEAGLAAIRDRYFESFETTELDPYGVYYQGEVTWASEKCQYDMAIDGGFRD